MQDLKQSTKLTFWPSPQDYNEAIQNPPGNFADEELRAANVHTDKLGLPRPMTGAFASVYRMSADKRDVAVRCFLRNISDQEQRYKMISDFVQHDELPYTVGFEFLRQGIRVNSQWYPLLKMEYVEGLPLDAFVRLHAKNHHVMTKLADEFLKMTQDLRRDGIAHGDLQHGNILVIPDNELRLVDYDGMFVPGMENMQSNEIGHPNYQHPRRSASDFGPYLDNFSAWLIYASLKSIALDPSLFQSLAGGDDCLLFRRDDLVEPDYSQAFSLLEANAHRDIVRLARLVRWNLTQAPHSVAPLSAEIPDVGELPKLEPHRPRPNNNIPDWMQQSTPDYRSRSRRNQPPPLRPQRQQQQQQQQQQGPPAPPPGIVPIPTQLLRSGPRRVKWKTSNDYVHPVTGQFLMLLNPLVWLMIGYFVHVIPADEKIITRGADSTAVVESSRWVGGKNAHWTADYRYNAADGTHYGSINTDSEWLEGDTRPVRYDKGDPANHVVDKSNMGTVNAARGKVNGDWMILWACIMANLALEALWLYKPLRHRHIVMNGKAARGKISRKFTKKGDKGAVYYYLEFTFNSNSGPVTSKQQVSHQQWNARSENDSVIVVYRVNNPEDCVVYEYGLYEAI